MLKFVSGKVFSFDWAPPTVVQEEAIDALGLVDLDDVPSFDCQENPDDLDSVDPVCTTTSLPGTTRQ